MKSPTDIIIRPIISERSMAGAHEKKYTFEVAKSATKIDIARAVAEQFKTKVVKVNTISVLGKQRRRGKDVGYTPAWKKAIVTLDSDAKPIEFFEGML